MDRPRFTDNLDAIKFICKDFWSELFKKQIDNLKTNHRVGARILRRIHIILVWNAYDLTFIFITGYFCIAR